MQTKKTTPHRERILLTAHELFYRNGIRATGIDRVIAEAHVTKTTFYRYFPSKNKLIIEFMQYRHQHWMAWFTQALQRHGNNIDAVPAALNEWFSTDRFRGCAFINSLVELGGELPEIIEITRRHKQDMTDVIVCLLPSSQQQDAPALSLAIDGAIIRAQLDPAAALTALQRIITALVGSEK